MKKGILLAVLFIGCYLVFTKGAYASDTILYAYANHDDVNVYDNRTGALIPIVTLNQGQPLVVEKYASKNWIEVKIGNGFGYLYAGDVKVISTTDIKNMNLGYSNTNLTIITTIDKDVYDNTSGSLVKFAVLKKDRRYPIISDIGNWWGIDVGGRIGYISKINTAVDNGIPVLMYHHILTPEEKADSMFANASTTVTTEEFNDEMGYLKEQGFETITIEDLEKYLNHSLNLPSKIAVITFDDGIKTSYLYAYPKLKELGFKSINFIITGRIPEQPADFDYKGLQFLSYQEMDAMKDVFEFGIHTDSLHNIVNGVSDVVSNTYDVVSNDFSLSKSKIDSHYFAYPFGQWNSDTLTILKNLNYTLAFTTQNTKVKLGNNPLLLPRLGIEPSIGLDSFAVKVNNQDTLSSLKN